MSRVASEGFRPPFVPPASTEPFTPLWPAAEAQDGFEERLPLASRASANSEPGPSDAAPSPPPDPVAEARREAERILAAAEAEAARQIAEAVAAECQAQREAFRQAAEELLAAWRTQRAARLEEIERAAARLIVVLGRRILQEHFHADEEAILPVVREALRPLAEAEQLRIVIAPPHEPAVRAAFDELRRVLRDTAQLEIIVDQEAEPYGCVVHSEIGSIDARLETRLESLQRAITQRLAPEEAA